MHNIHPNTTHQIVTISLAVRCGNECDAAEHMNALTSEREGPQQ